MHLLLTSILSKQYPFDVETCIALNSILSKTPAISFAACRCPLGTPPLPAAAASPLKLGDVVPRQTFEDHAPRIRVASRIDSNLTNIDVQFQIFAKIWTLRKPLVPVLQLQ